jgi:hypothetical protein
VTMFSMVGLMAISGGRFGRRQKRSWGEREQGRREYLADLDVTKPCISKVTQAVM